VAITAAVTARSVPAHHGWNGIYGRQKGALRCRLSPVRPRIRLCGNFVSAGQEHKRQPPPEAWAQVWILLGTLISIVAGLATFAARTVLGVPFAVPLALNGRAVW